MRRQGVSQNSLATVRRCCVFLTECHRLPLRGMSRAPSAQQRGAGIRALDAHQGAVIRPKYRSREGIHGWSVQILRL
jgi:hypothetical protein